VRLDTNGQTDLIT